MVATGSVAHAVILAGGSPRIVRVEAATDGEEDVVGPACLSLVLHIRGVGGASNQRVLRTSTLLARLQSAARVSGLSLPNGRITLHLYTDWPMATWPRQADLAALFAILGEAGEFGPAWSSAVVTTVCHGAVEHDGNLSPSVDVAALVLFAAQRGFHRALLPVGTNVSLLKTLEDVVVARSVKEALFALDRWVLTAESDTRLPLSIALTHPLVRLAMLVAVTGGHHVIMAGAEPPTHPEFAEEVRRLASDVQGGPVALRHITPNTRTAQILGDGSHLGELALAHGGVLHLDEPEKMLPSACRLIRPVLEQGVVTVRTRRGTYTHPADFALVTSVRAETTTATAWLVEASDVRLNLDATEDQMAVGLATRRRERTGAVVQTADSAGVSCKRATLVQEQRDSQDDRSSSACAVVDADPLVSPTVRGGSDRTTLAANRWLKIPLTPIESLWQFIPERIRLLLNDQGECSREVARLQRLQRERNDGKLNGRVSDLSPRGVLPLSYEADAFVKQILRLQHRGRTEYERAAVAVDQTAILRLAVTLADLAGEEEIDVNLVLLAAMLHWGFNEENDQPPAA